jgi:hypothetical protein
MVQEAPMPSVRLTRETMQRLEYGTCGEEEITMTIYGESRTLWVMRTKTPAGNHLSLLGELGCEATLMSPGWPEDWDGRPDLIPLGRFEP